MPELPEVEAARRTLEPLVVGRRITRLEVLRPQALRSHSPQAAARAVVGRRITGVRRLGKVLLFDLEGGLVLSFHFALWAVVRVTDAPQADAASAVFLHLDDGQAVEFRELQLSNLNLYRARELDRVPYLAGLGPDPLDSRLTARRFRERVAGRGAVRSLLTDQTRLAGIGNLWVQEILFAAGLRPMRPAASLTEDDWRRLYRATRSVLRRGIAAGGEPEFTDAQGRRGRFRLMVYDRGGQPCRVCGARIVATRSGGRPVAYCPRCQR